MTTQKLPKALKVFVICGEPSGDALAADAIKDLIAIYPGQIRLRGIGGAHLKAQGLESLFPMEDLSLMGLAEILPHIPKLLGRIDLTARAIIEGQPDIVLSVDAPDFCFRVTKQLREKACHFPHFIHYVAPTVWAWRSGRAKKVARLYDHILCLLPFEPKYFEREGLAASYVGHSALRSDLLFGDRKEFVKAVPKVKNKETLGVLFGSRSGELKRLGKTFADTAKAWLAEDKNRIVIAPTLPHLQERIQELFIGYQDRVVTLTEPKMKPHAFAAMDQALAVSGTVGLELALCKIPHIIGYKAHPLTYFLAKRLVKVDYAHLANILLDEMIVPEFIQSECRVENLSQGLAKLDKDKQESRFEQVRDKLQAPITPAQAILNSYRQSLA